MSKPLSKAQLIRAEWLRRLECEGDRQCIDRLRLGNNVCALGLLVEVVAKSIYGRDHDFTIGSDVDQAIDLAGLHHKQGSLVASLNDGVRRMSMQEVWDMRLSEKRLGIKRHCFDEQPLRWDYPYEQRSHSFREIKQIVESWFMA